MSCRRKATSGLNSGNVPAAARPVICARRRDGAVSAPGREHRRIRLEPARLAGNCAVTSGVCSRCWQRHPNQPYVAGEHLAARLVKPPDWFPGLVAHLAVSYSPGRACTPLTVLARLLEDEHPNHPQAVLYRARRPGRSMGSLARSMEDFFTEHGLAMPTDHAERLAAGRRQRRIDGVPEPLRPAAGAFVDFMLTARARARRAGTRPRSDHTIENALTTVRALAVFLNSQRGKRDWSTIEVADVEAFPGH